MKSLVKVLAGLILFAGSLAADTVETVFFRQIMSTANEVPPVEGVQASARAIIAAHVRRNDAGQVVSGSVDFDIDYTFGEAVTIQGLHIHDGLADVNGPVVIDTGLSGTNTVAAQGSGNIFRQVNVESGTALTALIGLLANPANFYVNLHTTTFPGGIIRSQLQRADLMVLRAILDPANEVPPVTLDAAGSGSVWMVVNRNAEGAITAGTVQYDVTYRFPSPVTFTGLHIHPGIAGTNGPVALNSTLARTDPDVIDVTQGSLRRRFDVSSGAALDALRLIFVNPAGAYLNLHTTVNTGGAMRGQLGYAAETSFQLPMSPSQEVPPISGLEASALAKVSVYVTRNAAGEVNSGTAIFDVNYRFPGSAEFTGFHIHTAAAGTNGPVVIGSDISGTNSLSDEDGVGNLYKIIDVGPTNANGLAALRSIVTTPENQYLNLHTRVNSGGAIRGQLVQGTVAMPTVSAGGVVNATNASGVAPASPGSLISIYGTNLARFTAIAVAGTNNRLPISLAGTEVRIGGISAPLLYVSPLQINAQVPLEVTAGALNVTVVTSGGISVARTTTVSAFAPAIFAVLRNSDFSRPTAANPARAGDDLAIFATGLGAVTPALATGQIAPLNPAPIGDTPLSATTATPTVSIAGLPATVTASLAAPGYAGLYQVNVRVPAAAVAGTQPLVLSVGGQSSNSVSVVIQ